MIAEGIVVHWDMADEYIEISPDKLTPQTSVTSTLEWWAKTKNVTKYRTHSEIQFLKDRTEISIWYHHPINSHIKKEDACWSKSLITIEAGSSTGEATWCDIEHKSHNGTVQWEVVKSGLLKKNLRETVSRTKRNQEMFRAALFSCQSGCAITKENTIEALEAAHIISSKKNGAEVIQNGILLRADLHRLYDAEKFCIDPNGNITNINPSLSIEYKKLLTSAKIEAEVLSRISRALSHQWKA